MLTDDVWNDARVTDATVVSRRLFVELSFAGMSETDECVECFNLTDSDSGS